MEQQLIFIYNAKSGFMHGVMDLIHKSASPKTYPCKLCQMTYSGAAINKVWKNYITKLNIPSIFLHKNEFEQYYPSVKIKYPAVLWKRDKSLKVLLSAEDFGELKDLSDLISKLNERLPDAKDKQETAIPVSRMRPALRRQGSSQTM